MSRVDTATRRGHPSECISLMRLTDGFNLATSPQSPLLSSSSSLPSRSVVNLPNIWGAILFIIVHLSRLQLAISSWLVARYEEHNNYPSTGVRDRARFLLFTSAWTVLFAFFYMALFLHSASKGSVLTSVASHLILYDSIVLLSNALAD